MISDLCFSFSKSTYVVKEYDKIFLQTRRDVVTNCLLYTRIKAKDLQWSERRNNNSLRYSRR